MRVSLCVRSKYLYRRYVRDIERNESLSYVSFIRYLYFYGILLRGLHNQILSSAHSSVVRGHVEFQTLGSSTNEDKKSLRLKSHWEFQGRD